MNKNNYALLSAAIASQVSGKRRSERVEKLVAAIVGALHKADPSFDIRRFCLACKF